MHDRFHPPQPGDALYGQPSIPSSGGTWVNLGDNQYQWWPSPEGAAAEAAAIVAAPPSDPAQLYTQLVQAGATGGLRDGGEQTRQVILAAGGSPELAAAGAAAQAASQAANEGERSEGFFEGMVSSGVEFAKEIAPLALAALATYTGASAIGSFLGGAGAAGSAAAAAAPVAEAAALPSLAEIGAYLPEVDMSLSSIFREAAKSALGSVADSFLGTSGGFNGVGPVISDSGPMYGYGGYSGMPAALPAAFPMIGAMGGAALRTLPAIGGAVMGAGRAVVAAATKKNAVKLAKVLGVQGAATALGIGAIELAQWVIDDAKRKGRGRGVTAAQLRTTRRTMRKVMGMARTIRKECSETGFIARRRAPTVYCAPRKR